MEEDIQRVVAETLRHFGRIDVFISNAGITAKGGIETANADWQKLWEVNVMSRLYAARAVVPTFLKQVRRRQVRRQEGRREVWRRQVW
jgi:NAD(P)-dependent dehydrogenase (short-subunit alcohol dehydrogenase family)